MRPAGEAVVAWSSELGHRRLWASVWDWNVASRRVPQKLGFHDSGARHPVTEHGRMMLTVREISSSPRVGQGSSRLNLT
ncbi:hypothetical protein Q9R19_05880 [Microbacterium sp. ARD32]|uniref:GNAT family N-acetyltransferase n=1 Tax=Microbacterium sp. ARD32 TaxID=2962577 RepID=UPI00288107BF|nr:hypothetical protein [Microbacterium sp. ARD32]MDT0157152.1 hypothetical protein [Microbacterium sp. ARD32]